MFVKLEYATYNMKHKNETKNEYFNVNLIIRYVKNEDDSKYKMKFKIDGEWLYSPLTITKFNKLIKEKGETK